MGDMVDIVTFQMHLKQTVCCVTLNPWVTLGPQSLRQGVTNYFILHLSQVRVLVIIVGCVTHY